MYEDEPAHPQLHLLKQDLVASRKYPKLVSQSLLSHSAIWLIPHQPLRRPSSKHGRLARTVCLFRGKSIVNDGVHASIIPTLHVQEPVKDESMRSTWYKCSLLTPFCHPAGSTVVTRLGCGIFLCSASVPFSFLKRCSSSNDRCSLLLIL